MSVAVMMLMRTVTFGLDMPICINVITGLALSVLYVLKCPAYVLSYHTSISVSILNYTELQHCFSELRSHNDTIYPTLTTFD